MIPISLHIQTDTTYFSARQQLVRRTQPLKIQTQSKATFIPIHAAIQQVIFTCQSSNNINSTRQITRPTHRQTPRRTTSRTSRHTSANYTRNGYAPETAAGPHCEQLDCKKRFPPQAHVIHRLTHSPDTSG